MGSRSRSAGAVSHRSPSEAADFEPDARGRLTPLPGGVWCYLASNLPDSIVSAALIEATSRTWPAPSAGARISFGEAHQVATSVGGRPLEQARFDVTLLYGDEPFWF
jgi:hypothetical protein